MTKQSKIPNITIKEYFERLIKQDNVDKYDLDDDWEYDEETSEILRSSGWQNQTKEQEIQIIQNIQGEKENFKNRTPTQRELAMDTFGAEIQRKLKNCATSTTLHVAYVLNRDRQLIPVKNTILGMIHEYTGKKKDLLPQTFQQLEDMYVRGIATILLVPKNKKMPKRRGSKIEDTLPEFKSVTVKDPNNKEHLMFYSMQNEEVKFIIIDNLNMILGKIPSENFERSSLVAALKVLNNIKTQTQTDTINLKEQQEVPNTTPTNTSYTSTSTGTNNQYTSQYAYESKINEAKPRPIPPQNVNQTQPVKPTKSKPRPIPPQNVNKQVKNINDNQFNKHMLTFFTQQLEYLIKSKYAKQFNNPPAVDKEGQLLRDQQKNIINPGGYSQTIKALKSENQQSIKFVLYRLNFAINRIDRL